MPFLSCVINGYLYVELYLVGETCQNLMRLGNWIKDLHLWPIKASILLLIQTINKENGWSHENDEESLVKVLNCKITHLDDESSSLVK